MLLQDKQADPSQRLQQALRLHQQGQFDEAALCCAAILKAQLNHFDAMHLLGVLHYQQGRQAEALDKIQTALKWKPTSAEALSDLGLVFGALGQPNEALASYDKALAIRPDYAEALSNRGNALQNLKRSEEALASYDKALAIRPDYAEALNNRGNALHDLKRSEEALASYDKALAIRPDYADALFNRGLNALLIGDFSAGWRGYEYRWDRTNAEARKLLAPYPNWKGEDIRGKRIIVYEEQGLGDVIQVSRFLTQLVALNAEVTFLLRSSLHRILSVSAPSVRLVAAPPKGEAFDFQCALMSLPGAFGTSRENLPSSVPYLFAEEGVVARWRERLGDHGLKIGICWQGNPNGTADIGRSFPLRCFQPLAAISGVRLISLQKAHGLDQLENLPSGMEVETLGEEFDGGPDTFIDTAAVMSCLHLIITSDTSVAHLAGALGRPVWVALKHVPDWRWMLDRSDSPWYSTMKLYRQTIRDDWDSVFDQVAADVAMLQLRNTDLIG
jgi:tetratricopeptide (TPR) repeat protein